MTLSRGSTIQIHFPKSEKSFLRIKRSFLQKQKNFANIFDHIFKIYELINCYQVLFLCKSKL